MGRKLKIFGGLFISSAVCGGVTAVWQRNENLQQRRLELDTQYAKMKQELDVVQRALTEEEKDHQRVFTALKKRHGIVDALWGERLHRYQDALTIQRDLIEEVPMGLSVLHGITNHYNHLANILPEYIAYDHGASKLHDLSLLMSMVRNPVGVSPAANSVHKLPSPTAGATSGSDASADSAADSANSGTSATSPPPPIAKVVDEIDFMFHGEPVVSSVVQSLRLNNGLRAIPGSLAELSDTFSLATKSLSAQIEKAESEMSEKARAAARKDADEEEGASPNLVHRSAHKVLSQMYVNNEPVTRQNESTEPNANALDLFVKNITDSAALRLLSSEDVKAASEHCGKLVQSAQALPAPVRDHPDVAAARDALSAWRRAAASYLVQQQATQVLESFHTILQYSFIDPHAGTPKEGKAHPSAQ